jgi:predicted RNase H-like HicB family nuclease
MDYLVVFEKCDDGSYSVYVPDLPGCVSSGDTLEEAKQMIQEAIALHIESMREHGEVVPPPISSADTIHTDAA